ncbi:MAG: type VI secretion system tip protein TssI/VgrG [Polyangiales bacterium]
MSPLPETTLDFAGADHLPWSVVYWHLTEALSSLYTCTLVLSLPDAGADPDALLERPATLTVGRGALARHVRGVVREVDDLGATATNRFVRVVLVPSLWTLSQRLDSRIWQELPVVDIVRDVLRAAGVYEPHGRLDVPDALRALPAREYCVQHRETDLDFVLRLLQEEGIPFTFRHDDEGGEALVLVDESPAWQPAPLMAGDAVPVTDAAMHVTETESIASFEPRRQVRPTGVSLRDFDFTRPRATAMDLTRTFPTRGTRELYESPARLSLHEYDDEAHAYPQHDGARHARVRHEAQHASARTAQGRGNVTGFAPGRSFTLRGHHRGEMDVAWLLTEVEHVGQAWSTAPADVRASTRVLEALRDAGLELPDGGHAVGERYRNRFRCIPATVPWRPLRSTPRPLVHGLQTARVVGPAGEEIHTDFHGRIKVQFHWDRLGREDEGSSVWMRVSQSWSGPGWGFVFIPRIGMEVLVAFLEGDPDRPMVVGCVYNGENHTPYGLPDAKTVSTIKTWSSPTTGGYNEIRFEDRAGEEQVYVQAERNHDTLVKNDQTLHVQRNRTKYIEGREKNTIDKDRVTTVHGNESKEVDGNQDVQVHGFSGATLHVDEHYHVTADASLVLECGDSKITMTPGTIDVHSRRIKVHGEKLVEIIGELVKINCPEGSHETAKGGQKKRNRFKELLTRMKRGVEKALAKLPAPLRRALRRAVSGALRRTIEALMRGRLPDVGAIARGALGELAQGAFHSAMGAMNAGFARLGALPWVQGNAVLEGMLGMARGAVAQGLGRVAQVTSGFLRDLGGNEAWQEVQRSAPGAAAGVLRSVGAPVLREALMGVQVPQGAGREGMRLFDGVAGVGREGLWGMIRG